MSTRSVAAIFVASGCVLFAGCQRSHSDSQPKRVQTGAAPERFSPEQLAERTIQRRAVEAVIWGMPAVNYDLMLQEMLNKTTGKVGQFIYWGRPLDWHNQTLTPNPDTIYFIAFFNLHDGPMVLEVPPADTGSLNCNIVTLWQMPIEDAGAFGVDKGAGAKFVILPPAYDRPAPAGYTALRSDTYGGYLLLRSSLKSRSTEDVEASVAYGKRTKLYPLAQAGNPPATVFTDIRDIDFDSTIRYDASFFDHLDRVVQGEAWLDRDRAMIDPLKSLGIEKGKPFSPDAHTRELLDAAALEAKQWLDAKYEAGWQHFFDGGHWRAAAPAEMVRAAQAGYTVPDDYPTDLRGMVYSFAFIGLKRLGVGQFYLVGIQDASGADLDGGKNYRLHVPPNVPVEQYWSVTVYDRETHALVRNMARASCASNDASVQRNADGSVDVYFGPVAPAGQESNWVPTDATRGFELMFRLYGPTKALFAKQWTLPDAESISNS